MVSGAVARELFPRSGPVAVGSYDQTGLWTTVTSAAIEGPPPMFPLPADGEISVVSSSALDTALGSGARSFRVLGVARSGDPSISGSDPPWQTEVLLLNGLTPVQSALGFYGGIVEDGEVNTAGAAFTNQGSITVRRVSDGKVLYVVPPTWGHSRSDYSFVPNGWIAVIREMILYWDGDTQVHWRLRVHAPDGTRTSQLGGSIQRENSGNAIELRGGFLVPSLHAFWWEAVRDVGGLGANAFMSVFAVVEYYLDNDVVI